LPYKITIIMLMPCRCGKGDKMFHVETTAWEGELAWKPPQKIIGLAQLKSTMEEPIEDNKSIFATYGSYFWSNK